MEDLQMDVKKLQRNFFKKFVYHPTQDKTVQLETMPHYTDRRFEHEQTVFGKQKDGLHYDYSDRLWQWDYKKAKHAAETANASNAISRSAEWYEINLSAYFRKTTEIRHIVAGVNRSNG